MEEERDGESKASGLTPGLASEGVAGDLEIIAPSYNGGRRVFHQV